MMAEPVVPVRLLNAEADLEEPDELTLAELVAVLRDLLKVEHRLDGELTVRLVRAMATAVDAATILVRQRRGAIVAELYAGGLSYPAIGELFGGVTGERARQWAQEAPPTTTDSNRSKST